MKRSNDGKRVGTGRVTLDHAIQRARVIDEVDHVFVLERVRRRGDALRERSRDEESLSAAPGERPRPRARRSGASLSEDEETSSSRRNCRRGSEDRDLDRARPGSAAALSECCEDEDSGPAPRSSAVDSASPPVAPTQPSETAGAGATVPLEENAVGCAGWRARVGGVPKAPPSAAAAAAAAPLSTEAALVESDIARSEW